MVQRAAAHPNPNIPISLLMEFGKCQFVNWATISPKALLFLLLRRQIKSVSMACSTTVQTAHCHHYSFICIASWEQILLLASSPSTAASLFSMTCSLSCFVFLSYSFSLHWELGFLISLDPVLLQLKPVILLWLALETGWKGVWQLSFHLKSRITCSWPEGRTII